jgi:hypothetical protein
MKSTQCKFDSPKLWPILAVLSYDSWTRKNMDKIVSYRI